MNGNGFSAVFDRFISTANSRRKLLVFYIVFVIMPILVVDSLFLTGVYRTEMSSKEHLMENEANAINYTFANQVDQAAKLGNALYSSQYIQNFVKRRYNTNLEYFNAYQSLMENTQLKLVEGQSGLNFSIYVDNNTITNGGWFQQINQAYGKDWYNYFKDMDSNKGLYFSRRRNSDGADQRTIYYFQKLNYYNVNSDDFVLIIIDYGKCTDIISNLNYENRAYICDGDRILLSNSRYSNINKDYDTLENMKKIAYSQDFKLYGHELTIDVVGDNSSLVKVIGSRWYQFLLLILVNLMLPIFVSNLMNVTYQNKLREQQTIMARKNAELLALHSQINPHFLFNALESIRMHSLLKNEVETSNMVEHLAKLQRQYTEWNDDSITVEKELEFVDAYLQLQKYRFGDRLSFEIDVDEECKEMSIPKLTLVTFAENACVHGIESKTNPGWVFVRIYCDDKMLNMEVEDTGGGMEEAEAMLLLTKMRHANIDMLKEKGRVGVVNACLRLKMISNDEVTFDLDSEPGTGTLIQIKIPKIYCKGVF